MATADVAEAGKSAAGQVYTSRRNLFAREAAYRLAPDALERLNGDAVVQRLPYATVRELALIYDPTPFDSSRFRCEVIAPAGRAVIVSTHYTGFASFENRAATYTPFVRDLVRNVARAAPDCRFRAGKRAWIYFAEQLLLLAMLLLLVFTLATVGGLSWTSLALLKLAIVAAYIPIAIKYLRRNWPRTFDPNIIPDDLLP